MIIHRVAWQAAWKNPRYADCRDADTAEQVVNALRAVGVTALVYEAEVSDE